MGRVATKEGRKEGRQEGTKKMIPGLTSHGTASSGMSYWHNRQAGSRVACTLQQREQQPVIKVSAETVVAVYLVFACQLLFFRVVV